MVFKIYYQPTKAQNPKRENTRSMYVEADSKVTVMNAVEHQTNYNIEQVEALDDATLEYEKQNPDFKLTEFDK
ncbi:MAG TPA: DNA-dependent RNA polymerase auxiliary subunit epsilon family protein [Candidatus Ligilactobacillus avistercoris]|nr:DNA-dependent RNA polymerase auxiliary subunit epsilon family protein [Candidatus Ligilactobacillus avistercoris]